MSCKKMEQLIDAQHEVYGRISRCVENLKKIKSAKVSIDTINATPLLDNKWTKFEEQHEQIQAEFWKEVKEHDCTKKDFPSEVEHTYLGQRAELAEIVKSSKERPSPSALQRRASPYRGFNCRSSPESLRTGLPSATCSAPSWSGMNRCPRSNNCIT